MVIKTSVVCFCCCFQSERDTYGRQLSDEETEEMVVYEGGSELMATPLATPMSASIAPSPRKAAPKVTPCV